ncbi:type I restriction endonuclease subunit R [Hymenobacter sp. BT664]|uniref:Type I restriction enzyme endonuclease subunit n=1 Tax=Hymenobacter montanus TaxID=2771359 RepID=A0A927BGD7_9BACT|nr:type I restriction endonuclease subunit R [Hymenobacter montanus]MBD2769770.1 type I restriction endonuclease subunit R [Hymenobacter montanus]
MVNEQQIEYGFIGDLQRLKYTYRDDIRNNTELERNFRERFEALNRVTLSDAEFSRLRDEIVNPDVFVASKTLRARNTFIREDGTPLQYTLVNIKDWCKNEFEVINQLRINTASSFHRYDVILLLNGLPLVQIELKTLDVTPRKAMKQIADYKNDHGASYTNTLLCFVQLFIVSNRTSTYYLANNRREHFDFSADEQFLPVYQYADEKNRKINHLSEFAEKFLTKCTLAEMISRYMVLVESEQRLLVMRPYQIYAVKAIVDCIHQNRGNGYIWHTTGSGKTLTSFKASTLLKDNPDIEKCLFVVDRKDLDRQTREEFNKFQEGCVEENTNTGALVRRLLSDDYADKVIVTTIQKLGLALDPSHPKDYKTQLQPLSHKRVVLIFDECHRSQFGENHKAIKAFFPKAQLFGFTGTPIFEDNAIYTQVDGREASYQTTEDIFQKCLHSYTITHAIEDKNVLRFHVDYFKPDGKPGAAPGSGPAQQAVVKYILEKHDAATLQRRFNAVLATQSINDAIAYYDLFRQEQTKRDGEPDFRPLHIACVFSPPAEGNADVRQIQEDLPTEKQDNQVEPDAKKDALKRIIHDYNQQYGTNHHLGEFDLYYQDVQQRIKAQKWPVADYPRHERIDITIVVDMLLTGFDSKYLNTLYVDKNLKHHGLIQAFSRTNRVLNDTKPYGHVLDFRQQQPAVDAAIALFSGIENKQDPKEIWLVAPASEVMKDYEKAVQALESFMQGHGLPAAPEEVANLQGDLARGEFINTFKEVQRLRTQLDQYTDLGEPEKAQLETLLPLDDLRAFRGQYLETAKRLRDQQGKGKNPAPPNGVQFDLDFEFVLFASAIIDYDYIMGLMAASTTQAPKKQKLTREQIIALLGSSANLMDEADDLTAYFAGLPTDRGFTEAEIRDGYEAFKAEKTAAAQAAIAARHGLAVEALTAFVDGILRRMIFDSEGLGDLLAPLGLGWKARAAKEGELMADLIPLLQKRAQGREISGLAAYE